MTTPLEDPKYEPRTRPVNGQPNPEVKLWGPRSQLRWFKRFWGSDEMEMVRPSVVSDYFCQSVEHTGFCCSSCLEDFDLGYDYPIEGHCCCRAMQNA